MVVVVDPPRVFMTIITIITIRRRITKIIMIAMAQGGKFVRFDDAVGGGNIFVIFPPELHGWQEFES